MSLIQTLQSHLVIMLPVGPVLKAEVGDTLQVMFKNKADRIYSIQPHGLHYDKPFEGVFYQDGETCLHHLVNLCQQKVCSALER